MSDDTAARPRRPVWVWIIFVWFVFSVVWTLLSFYLIETGALPLEPAQKAYFERLTTVDYAASIVLALLNVAGAVALFMLRKAALPLFLASVVLGLLVLAWQTVARGWTEATGGSGLVGSAIGYALLIAVCLYAWRLTRRGVLR